MSNRPPAIPIERVEPELEFSSWVAAQVLTHRLMLGRVAMMEGLTSDEALDAVQEGLAAFIANPAWRDVRLETAETGRLLATLVKNQARNMRRRLSRKDVGMDALPGHTEVDRQARGLDELLVEAQEHLRLTGCIATLNEMQRAVVTARFLEGISGLKVAAEMGLTPSNVAVILYRARESLRGCLSVSQEAFGHP